MIVTESNTVGGWDCTLMEFRKEEEISKVYDLEGGGCVSVRVGIFDTSGDVVNMEA